MIVGVAVVELRVHESQSLKEKRGVVRKIVGAKEWDSAEAKALIQAAFAPGQRSR